MFRSIRQAIKIYREDGLYSLLLALKWYIIFRYERNKVSPRSRIRQLRYRIRYGSSMPKPYQLIWIDPKTIKQMLVPNFKSNISPKGTHIISGEWDVNHSGEGLMFDNNVEQKYEKFTLIRIKDYVFYQSMQQHFLNETSWENTDIYKWFCDNQERLSSGSNYRKDKISQRLESLDKLYKDMNKNGYATQRELLAANETVMNARGIPTPEYDEIMVNIGRDGDIILDDGRHRLMLAKILDLEIIPVRIFVRHSKWQAKRKKLATSGLSETDFLEYKNHPDLQDL